MNDRARQQAMPVPRIGDAPDPHDRLTSGLSDVGRKRAWLAAHDGWDIDCAPPWHRLVDPGGKVRATAPELGMLMNRVECPAPEQEDRDRDALRDRYPGQCVTVCGRVWESVPRRKMSPGKTITADCAPVLAWLLDGAETA